MIGPDVGGDCDKDGTPNPTDTDDDDDFLPDSIEKTARTNPCVATATATSCSTAGSTCRRST